jgi:hypothetical protein
MDTTLSRRSILFGIGAVVGIFLLLLGLKLTGVTRVALWSWWLVTAPLWGPWALALLVLGVAWAFFTAVVRFSIRR